MDKNGSTLMQRYELGRLLGKGTFAKVYHARNLETGASVAIKVVHKEKILKIGLMDQIEREISVMRLVKHPNVVELHEVMASKKKIYLVMEYVKGGELFSKVARGKLKEEDARRYFQQLIGAVDYCHSRGVCHRDLKPENLLLDERGNLKVSDFGLSALAQSKHQDGLLHTTCGTPAYVSPEVICRKGYDGCKADIWSCGVILYVLLSGYLPFHDSNLMVVYRKIRKAEFKCPNWFTPEQCRLVSKMLDPNPSTRIAMGKIMENSWFTKNSPPKSIPGNDAETVEQRVKPCKCSNLNAFDIISYSAGFDLSGFFEDKEERKEVRFTSNKQASTIISRLEDIARRLRLKVKRKDGGSLRMEGAIEGRKGVMGLEAEIFEITPELHIVEVKKSSGDTLEYQNVLKHELRPGLNDIVWTWQGERQQED